MNRLKDIWGGQDDMNRVLFLIAVAVFVVPYGFPSGDSYPFVSCPAFV